MLVFGTRPEAIKMCPLVKEFQKYTEQFKTIVCVTGQHREMLDQVLTIFDIKPDYDLNIMRQGQDLYDVTARVLTGMRDVLKECCPDVVLVHGDTTTSTAAALASFYMQIPVGHVEAGLRTHNIHSPWPEEMNRQITGRIATYNFAPTPLSEKNLIVESAQGQIYVTGNTVIDALQMVVDKLRNDAALSSKQEQILATAGSIKKKLDRVRFSPNTSWIGLRTLGLRCMGYTKSTSGYFSERSFMAVTMRIKPSPKFSRRCPVISTSFLPWSSRVIL